MNVLIPDPPVQNVLFLCRHLRRDHRMWLVGRDPGHGRSRFAGVKEGLDPSANALEFVRRLDCVARGLGGVAVAMPVGHDSTAAVSLHRGLLGVPCVTPPYDVLRFGHDKLLTYKICCELDIPVPETVEASRSLVETAGTDIHFPFVLKARRCCGVGTGFRLVRSVEGYDAAFSWLVNHPTTSTSTYHDPLVQEYIPGSGRGQIHDVVGLYEYGHPVAMVSQRRVETFPLFGGVGGWNVTTSNPGLVEQARTFLDYAKWHGPFQAEFIYDARDGRYKLLELNPKFWGTMELAVRAGVDIPRLALRIALDQGVDEVGEYKVGVKWMWPFPQGFRNLVEEPSLGRLARMFWRPIDLSDPRPDLWNIYYNARWLAGRKVRQSEA